MHAENWYGLPLEWQPTPLLSIKEHNETTYLWWYLKPELLGIANGREEWNRHIWEFFPWGLVIVPTHHLSTNPKLIWYTQLQELKRKIRSSLSQCHRAISYDIPIKKKYNVSHHKCNSENCWVKLKCDKKQRKKVFLRLPKVTLKDYSLETLFSSHTPHQERHN